MVDDADCDYRQLLLALGVAEGLFSGVTVADIAQHETRCDLGLTSLNVILLIARYLDEASGDVTFDPGWVAELETVDGIIAVMQSIDGTRSASVPTG
jgi:hypothetical protein